METITIQNQSGREYKVKAKIKEITDHLLRLTIRACDFDNLRPLTGFPITRDKILRDMDTGVWYLVVIESMYVTYTDTKTAPVIELLAETEGLKKVQRRIKYDS